MNVKQSRLKKYRRMCDKTTFNAEWHLSLRDALETMSPQQSTLLNRHVERLQAEFARTRIGRLGAMEVLAAIGVWINSQEGSKGGIQE